MAQNNRELEVKFWVTDLEKCRARLEELGARLEQPRVYEINLRFDLPDGGLARTARVLRLRYDVRARLTYKGPGRYEGGARLRQEIEFEVANFENARALLEALGYEVAMLYEKYRTTYRLDDLEIVLDELPYGDFVEIEGPEAAGIQEIARQLGLDWEARAPDSYVALFEQLKQAHGLDFRDLSFENFEGRSLSVESTGLKAADR